MRPETIERALRRRDPGYPGPLHHIFDPPEEVWVRARPGWRWRERVSVAVGIVGARDATAYGIGAAQRLRQESKELRLLARLLPSSHGIMECKGQHRAVRSKCCRRT